MAPQGTTIEPSPDKETFTAPEASDSNDGIAEPNVEGGSYWDAPPEQKLEGKTLSTMELSMLAQDEHTQERKGEEPTTAAAAAAAGSTTRKKFSYWEWQESIRKSLSTLSMTELLFQQGKKQQQNEAEKGAAQQEGAEGKESEETPPAEEVGETQPATTPSYWFWRNASFRNLSTGSLTALEDTAKAADNSKPGDDSPSSPSAAAAAAAAEGSKPTYWFWRNASLTNLSNVSLNTMEKTSREADRIAGKESEAGGPISNLQHKLRSSWRASFRQLSTNSLSKLEESGPDTNSESWKNNPFFTKRSSTTNDSVREEGEGAIEF